MAAKKKAATGWKPPKVVVETDIKSEEIQINFGHIDDYRGYIYGKRENGKQEEALLKYGCHHWSNRKAAEAHYDKDNVSKESGEHRPRIRQLIEWAAGEFERRGYKW